MQICCCTGTVPDGVGSGTSGTSSLLPQDLDLQMMYRPWKKKGKKGGEKIGQKWRFARETFP